MAQIAGRIVHELLDGPHTAEYRVAVRRIHALVEARGLSPQSAADGLGLDVADVYRPLAYSHDQPGEMHAIGRCRERCLERSREHGVISGPLDR